MKLGTKIIGTLLLLTLAACGGGGGGSSAGSALPPASQPGAGGTLIPPSSAAVGTVSAKASAVSSGLPLSTKSKFRRAQSLRSTMGLTIASVEVDGAIYPGTAGSVPVVNKQTLTPVNNQVSIDLTFSNVPAGNNEWMLLNLIGIASDGSKLDLGWLASLVNVTANQGTSVGLGATSTQEYEVFHALLWDRILSSVDLADPALATTLATQIAAAGQTPDATAQLYTPIQLGAIFDSIVPNYIHNLTVDTSTLVNASYISILPDYTNKAENNLTASLYTDTGVYYPVPANNAYGPNNGGGGLAPCYAFSQQPAGPAPPTDPKVYDTCLRTFSVSPNQVFVLNNVYGGPVLVGMSDFTTPFTGGWTSLPSVGLAPAGTTAHVTQAATDQAIAVTDPQAIAFNCAWGMCGNFLTRGLPGFINPFYPRVGGDSNLVWANSNGFGPTSNIVHADTWGYANQAAAGLEFCANTETDPCASLASIAAAGNTYTVHREFTDPGTNFSYYKYAGSGGITSIGQGQRCNGGPQGMVAKTDGTSASGSFTTTTPFYVGYDGSPAWISLSGNSCDSNNVQYDMRAAATWSVSLTASDGTTYTGSMKSGYNYVNVPIDGLLKTIQVTSMTITYTMPANTAPPAGWGINYLYSYTNQNEAVVHGSIPATIKRHTI